MKIAWKGKRWLALALAFVLLLTMLPPMKPLAFSEEIGEKLSSEDYKKYIGCDAWFAGYSTPLANDPETAGNPLSVTPFNAYGYENIKLVIEDCYYDATYDALWYKVKAAPGYTLPNEVELKPWVFQDYVLNPWGASLKIAEPETVAGTVTDSNGNPILGSDGQPLTVTVSGGLPEGAIVSASIPEINGEKLPNVFDIKIYDKDGKEWQPIDEGRKVTIAIPISDPEVKFVDMIHFIDHAEAIHDGVEYWPIKGADAEILALLADAIVASDREGYVAVEIAENVAVSNKMATIQTKSFSVYVPSNNDLIFQTENGSIQFANTSDGADTSPANTIYATPNTSFSFITENVVAMDIYGGEFFEIIKGGEYAEITDIEWDGWLFNPKRVTASVSIDDDTPAGTSIWVKFQNSNTDIWEIIIVRPVEIKFDANLSQDITYSGLPADRTYDATEDNRVITDGNLVHFNIPSNIPTAVNPEDPADTYTFVGWNTSPAGDGTPYTWNGSAFNPTYLVPTKDMTLYAMWERNDCKVTFNHNNGTGTEESIIVDYNGYVSMPKMDPERPGYIFLGWSASKDGSGKRYHRGDSIQVKSDVILYALWGIELHINAIGGTISVQRDGETKFIPLTKDNTLGFDVQSSTSGGVTTTTYYIVVPEDSYSKAYFRFTPDASNKTIRGDAKGSEMEFLKAIGTDNLNGDVLISEAGLTQYTVITFTAENKLFVSFDSAGGSVVSSQLVSKGDTINLNHFTTNREGYDFDGWYVDNTKVEGSYKVSDDITFTARWTPKKFNVTVNAGYGVESVTGAGQYDYSSAVKVTATMKPGYSFGGWTSDAVVGSASAEYTFLVPNGDVNLTAYGELINYKINYVLTDANGIAGTNHADNPAIYTVESETITLKNPTAPTNYQFVGWKEGTTIVSGSTGEKTFTAIWALDVAKYTVEIYIENVDNDNYTRWQSLSNTGTIGTTVTINVDDYTSFIPVGFTVSEKMEHVLSGTVQADGSLTLKVYIDRNRYTVTGTMDNVTVYTQTVKYDASSTEMKFVPASGYVISSITVNGVAVDVSESDKYGYTYEAQSNVTGNITVEVKTEPALTSLTIQVTGCNDSDQAFIFTVKSIEDNVDLKVTVKGSNSVTIDGLIIGQKYTITIDNDWSWRYESKQDQIVAAKDTNADKTANSITVTLEVGELVTFTLSRENNYWLDGNDYFQG